MASSLVLAEWVTTSLEWLPPFISDTVEWGVLIQASEHVGQSGDVRRQELISDWMWCTVLPVLQPYADRYGFGLEWQRMLDERTSEAASLAKAKVKEIKGGYYASEAAAMASSFAYFDVDDDFIPYAVYAAEYTAEAAGVFAVLSHDEDTSAQRESSSDEARDALEQAFAAGFSADADPESKEKSDYADELADISRKEVDKFEATAYDPTVRERATKDVWQKINPCGLLEQLIAVG